MGAFYAVALHRYGGVAQCCSSALLSGHCTLSIPVAWQKNEGIALIRLCLGIRQSNVVRFFTG